MSKVLEQQASNQAPLSQKQSNPELQPIVSNRQKSQINQSQKQLSQNQVPKSQVQFKDNPSQIQKDQNDKSQKPQSQLINSKVNQSQLQQDKPNANAEIIPSQPSNLQPIKTVKPAEPEKEHDAVISIKKLQIVKHYVRLLQNPDQLQLLLEKKVDSKIHVLDESERHFGDYIIVFPNPDHYDVKHKEISITYEEMMPRYIKALPCDSQSKKVQKHQELIKYAFQIAFLQIDKPDDEEHEGDDQFQRQKKPMGPRKKKQNMASIDEKGQIIIISPFEERKLRGGAYLIFNDEEKIWTRSGLLVKDYLTLFRQLIILKLVYFAGFYIRQFISSGGEYLYFVLYQQDENLKWEAQRIALPKEISFEKADILSLEPIDSSFRPFRLNGYIWEDNLEIGEEHKVIRQRIKELIKLINFSKLAKETGQKPLEATQEIQDNPYESIQCWQAYLFYLESVYKQITEVRKKYEVVSADSFTFQDLKEIDYLHERETSLKNASSKEYVQKQVGACSENKNMNYRYLKKKGMQVKAKLIEGILIDSLQKAQEKYGAQYIYNIWNVSKFKPMGTYSSYFNPRKHINFNMSQKLTSLWKRSVVNQNKTTSLFVSMERNKLVNSIISRFVNLQYIITTCKWIDKSYCVNNEYELIGKQSTIFDELLRQAIKDPTLLMSQTKIIEEITQIGEKEDKKPVHSQESESRVVKLKEEEISGGLDGKNLYDIWLKTLLPWYVPTNYIKLYYGERIALYFYFLAYYTKDLTIIGLLGIPLFFIEFLLKNQFQLYRALLVAYSAFIVAWAGKFISQWKREELIFMTKYGMNQLSLTENELSSYYGKNVRSIANDNMNSIYYPAFYTSLKFFMTFVGISGFFIFEIGTLIGLLYLMKEFKDSDTFPYVPFLCLDVFVPASIWIFFSIFIDSLFVYVAYFVTKWENQRTMSNFESSFISKVLVFSFINRFGPPFMIAFVIKPFLMGCVSDEDDGNCYQMLIFYMRSQIFIQFGKNLLKILIPFFKQLLLDSINYSINLVLRKSDDKQSSNPFKKIDAYFETEFQKDQYQQYEELDGTVSCFLEIVSQFGLLANYGLPFPLIFMAAFVSNVVQIQIDKISLMKFTQRPLPINAKSIGSFVYFLELMSFIAILNNTGLITFTNTALFPSDSIEFMKIFIIIFVALFFIRVLMDLIYGDVDYDTMQILKRMNFISQRQALGFSKTKPSSESEAQLPIFKPFGTLTRSLVPDLENEKQ